MPCCSARYVDTRVAASRCDDTIALLFEGMMASNLKVVLRLSARVQRLRYRHGPTVKLDCLDVGTTFELRHTVSGADGGTRNPHD